MAEPYPDGRFYLEQRLDRLRGAQNADGGWGYFPGKASWLEPTAYAIMALHGEPAADRAWKLLCSWQASDGGWKPSASVSDTCWATSLCATIAMGRNEWNQPLQKGLQWLLDSSGAESRWWFNAAGRIGLFRAERDFSLKAWPWKPGDAGWVEPTAHALVALKQAALKFSSSALRERVRSGEAQLLDVRGRDGGWNYGAKAALGVDLPSYPETTALALLGLQGRKNDSSDLGRAFDLAERQLNETPSPLGRAWLTIAARVHGLPQQSFKQTVLKQAMNSELPKAQSFDVMITAVEALAADEGNYWFMKTDPS